MKTLLAFDVSNLCHRSFYALPQMSWEGRPTEVLFGFIRTVDKLSKDFGTTDFAFCFDDPPSFRQRLFPQYRQKRRIRLIKSYEEEKAKQRLRKQIDVLEEAFRRIARLSNVYRHLELEADDLLASVARSVIGKEDEEVILVSTDKDLYQCLADNVMMFRPGPKGMYTKKAFIDQYGINPRSWVTVKALSGCTSDCIPGIPGIGETYAVRYLCGELKRHTGRYQDIISKKWAPTVARNRELVTIPAKQTPKLKPVFGEFDPRRWRRLQEELGFGRVPNYE